MKKTLFFVSLLCIGLYCSPVAAQPLEFYMLWSNDLPNGQVYATVKLESLPGGCVQITTTIEDDTLQAGDNLGIQRFGLNYTGDARDLSITVQGASNWRKRIYGGASYGPFGEFDIDLKGRGNSRQNPLIITICHDTDSLAVGDFNVANDNGYNFSTHIAGFAAMAKNCGDEEKDDDCDDDCDDGCEDDCDDECDDGCDDECDEGCDDDCDDDCGECKKKCGCGEVTSAYFASTPADETAITLASFTALPGSGKVTLKWETSDETDNLGFNLYRAEALEGPFELVNQSIVLSKVGTGLGAAYEYVDTGIDNRKIYFYKLEDVDTFGVKTLHGPVMALPLLLYSLFE